MFIAALMPRASRFDSGSFIRLSMLHGFHPSCRKLSLHFCIRYYILHCLIFICDTILPIFTAFVNRKAAVHRCSSGETRLYKTQVNKATTTPLTILNGSVMKRTNVNVSLTNGRMAVPIPTMTSIGSL